MSEHEPSRHWRCYLDDMIRSCEKIINYTSNISDQESFLADKRTYDATVWNLGLLGKAARRIPNSVREPKDTIPWRNIIEMRNHLTHSPPGIDDNIVWHAVHVDVPVLLWSLRRLSQQLE